MNSANDYRWSYDSDWQLLSVLVNQIFREGFAYCVGRGVTQAELSLKS